MTPSERLARIETILEGHTDTQGQILAQTRLTNGRVSAHDTWIAAHGAATEEHLKLLLELKTTVDKHTDFRSRALGAIAVVAFGVAVAKLFI